MDSVAALAQEEENERGRAEDKSWDSPDSQVKAPILCSGQGRHLPLERESAVPCGQGKDTWPKQEKTENRSKFPREVAES